MYKKNCLKKIPQKNYSKDKNSWLENFPKKNIKKIYFQSKILKISRIKISWNQFKNNFSEKKITYKKKFNKKI